MSRLHIHTENHLVKRIGWLRAAVLGANDGIVLTAVAIVGVASAAVSQNEIIIAGVAGIVAGAMSMAAGEYVSVSSQSDTEQSDLARERRELAEDPELELSELTQIYVKRGLNGDLAREVAIQLTKKDAIGAHARDELGISEITTAHPVQAAFTSAGTFTLGDLPLDNGSFIFRAFATSCCLFGFSCFPWLAWRNGRKSWGSQYPQGNGAGDILGRTGNGAIRN